LHSPKRLRCPELPDFLTTHIDPFTGENDAIAPACRVRAPGFDPNQIDPTMSRNAPCPVVRARNISIVTGLWLNVRPGRDIMFAPLRKRPGGANGLQCKNLYALKINHVAGFYPS
jgi:hypothetical protein